MAKEKKITVSYFPRKSKKKEQYMIYCRLTYDRKSTMISTGKVISAKSLDEAKGMMNIFDFDKAKYSGLIMPNFIEDLVKYEIKKSKDNYSVVGFNERYVIYKKGLGNFLGATLLIKFLDELSDLLSYKKFNELLNIIHSDNRNKFLVFFNAIDFLRESFHFIVDNEMKRRIFDLVYVSGTFNYYSLEKIKKVDTMGAKIVAPIQTQPNFEEYYSAVESLALWCLNRPQRYTFTKSDGGISNLEDYTGTAVIADYLQFLHGDTFHKLDNYSNNRFSSFFPSSEFKPMKAFAVIRLINEVIENDIKM